MFTVLDLFSGIGGFSLGLERTGGFKTIAFCEIDPFCRQVLRKHWPGVSIYEDVTTAEFAPGQADVICGGFPCQDISNAGKRAGITGARSGLWQHLVDAIRVVRPKYAIVENVAALLGADMGVVLRDLAAVGYDAEWHCLPASAVGLYHDRERVWIVAYPTGIDGNAWGLLEACGIERSSLESRRLLSDALARRGRQQGQRLEREPRLARLVQRVPDRTHRLECQGNAVVPQIPEIIGRAILKAESA
jgi:DNA (cytosine-5)-methyltransferase 1